MRQTKFRGNVFVANLPHAFNDEQLAQLFDSYGLVLGACLARDAATAASKGCGLVNVAPPRAAEAAIAALNGATVAGRRIEVRAAAPDMAISLPRPPRAGRRAAPVAAKTARPVVVEYKRRGVAPRGSPTSS